MIERLLDYVVGWTFFAIAVFAVLATIQLVADFNKLDLVKIFS